MKYLFSIIGLLLAFAVHPVQAARLIPILISNGEDFMACDGVPRNSFSTHLDGLMVVQTYMFGNLLTPSSSGADVVLYSSSYYGLHPQSGPSPEDGQEGPGVLGDLHLFSQPVGLAGGRQGERTMNFSPDGVYIDGFIHAWYICFGGGTLELYIQIWAREPTCEEQQTIDADAGLTPTSCN